MRPSPRSWPPRTAAALTWRQTSPCSKLPKRGSSPLPLREVQTLAMELLAQQALHPLSDLAPNTLPRRVLTQNRRTQPALKAVQLPQQCGGIDEHSDERTQHSP